MVGTKEEADTDAHDDEDERRGDPDAGATTVAAAMTIAPRIAERMRCSTRAIVLPPGVGSVRDTQV